MTLHTWSLSVMLSKSEFQKRTVFLKSGFFEHVPRVCYFGDIIYNRQHIGEQHLFPTSAIDQHSAEHAIEFVLKSYTDSMDQKYALIHFQTMIIYTTLCAYGHRHPKDRPSCIDAMQLGVNNVNALRTLDTPWTNRPSSSC